MAGVPPTQTRFNWEDHDPYIINLVNKAIAAGQITGISPSALQVASLYRLTPPVRVLYSAACQAPFVTIVLNAAAAGSIGFHATTHGDGAGGLPTCAMPAHNPGDLILMFVSQHSDELLVATAGFQRVCSNYDGNSNARIEVYAKIADGTEPANFTITNSLGVEFWNIDAVSYNGVQGNGIAAAAQTLQQPNGASPYLSSAQLTGPWVIPSLMVFGGCLFGGTAVAALPTNQQPFGATPTVRQGVITGPNMLCDVVF